MAAKRERGTRKPDRNPEVADQRLDDIRFYWTRLTETQRERLYQVVARLVENIETITDRPAEEMPRVVLYDPKLKKME